jgi:hypothetical protein
LFAHHFYYWSPNWSAFNSLYRSYLSGPRLAFQRLMKIWPQSSFLK